MIVVWIVAGWVVVSVALAPVVGRRLAYCSRSYPPPPAPDWAWLIEHASPADLGWSEDNPAPEEAMAVLGAVLRQRAGRRKAADDALAAGLAVALAGRRAAEPAARAGRAAWQQRDEAAS